MGGPLVGVRVLELGGIGPVPFCGMMLADMGADVVRIDRPGDRGAASSGSLLRPRGDSAASNADCGPAAARAPLTGAHPVLHRARRSVLLDLKRPGGARAAQRIAEGCDVLLEGFRPGVAERLGLGPEELLARNPRLVYGRMTGWGQEGPYAHAPGHDINYLALSGALHTTGPAGGDPRPPVNLLADFGGGGMLLAYGVVCALLRSRASGQGQVVDAAMVDGSALLLAMTYGFLSLGLWTDQRGVNLLDGGAPFYRVYRCADGGHVAVGCLEPRFYAELLRVLGLADDPDFTPQNDRKRWPVMHRRLEEIFVTRTRDAWTDAFAGSQGCVTPVLSLREAPEHPHNQARGTYAAPQGLLQPMPAPRFTGTPAAEPAPAPEPGEHTAEVLAEAGLTPEEIAELCR